MKFLSALYLLAFYSYVRLGPKYFPHCHLLENLLYYFPVIFFILVALFGMGDTVHVQRRYVFPLHLLEPDFQFFEVFSSLFTL